MMFKKMTLTATTKQQKLTILVLPLLNIVEILWLLLAIIYTIHKTLCKNNVAIGI